MAGNGLDTFSMHSQDDAQGPTIATINEVNADDARALDIDVRALDPETAARRCLDQMIASPDVPLVADEANIAAEYRTIGTETVALTGAKVVKFAQYRHRIPVYGSLVTVELDDDNSLLSISSARGDPNGVDPVASVSPAQAQAVIAEDAGEYALPLAEPPRLYFYFDQTTQPAAWRLVYIAKDVRRDSSSAAEAVPELVDYVVDAHSGELVRLLPRTQSVAWEPADVDATDGLGVARRIRVQRDESGRHRLRDDSRNLETADFGAKDIQVHFRTLPGASVENPPDWDGAAVSAHANAQEVADYLLTVLRRNGLDNMGGPFLSTVNCTNSRQPSQPGEWKNAAWIGTQMVYGQRLVNGRFRSYAVAGDVVAHEITHGLTDRTARLEYAFESGALNESYSDIFGIIISNRNTPNIGAWNWQLGEDLQGTGIPLRDLRNPTAHRQPDHMDDFQVLTEAQDHGGVHINSGIHNKAAFNLITSTDQQGRFLFKPEVCAALFYLALTQFLSRTSGFRDSRRGVELAARTLFRREPPPSRAKKLTAIATAFDKVGVAASP